MDDERKAAAIAAQARASLGKYCMEECQAQCCRQGFLCLSQKEMSRFQGRTPINPHNDGSGSIDLGRWCPDLSEFRCTNYARRPAQCRTYPLSLKGTSILLSPFCPAAEKGLLYPYLRKLLSMGYSLRKPGPFGYSFLGLVKNEDPAPSQFQI